MLREIKSPRQIKDEMQRRWYSDDAMDLIVWLDEADNIAAFQLCYDKPFAEHALSWREDSGFYHNRVDDGEGRPGSHKGTPILVPDGEFSLKAIAEKFRKAAAEIDSGTANFIIEKLRGPE